MIIRKVKAAITFLLAVSAIVVYGEYFSRVDGCVAGSNLAQASGVVAGTLICQGGWVKPPADSK